MRKLIPFSLILFVLFSCTPTRYYHYNIKLEKPVESSRLYYENDTLSVSFSFNPKYIEFEVYNKLEDGIRINWDEVSVSFNGKARRIVHYSTGMTKINDVQPPTTIPPKSKLVDGLLPVDNINLSSIYGKPFLSMPDQFPITDNGKKKAIKYITGMKGQKVIVYLPFYLKGVYQSKTFEFLIVDVQAFKTKAEAQRGEAKKKK